MSRRQASKTPAHDQAEYDRVANETFRKVCSGFRFWRACGGKACRRAKSCAGEAKACFHRFWPHVSEYDKIWLRAAVKAQNAGHSAQEASRIGLEEAARCKALMARLESQGLAARAKDAPARPRPTEQAGRPQAAPSPRLRSL